MVLTKLGNCLFTRHCGIFILLMLIQGCGGPLVNVTVVDERTALENQILGTYEELDQDVMLLSSVRSVDSKGTLVKNKPLTDGKRLVIRAMQRSSFNRDDLNRYQLLGIIGENNQGGVVLLNPEKVQKNRLDFVNNLVKEENADRDIIMQRVIATQEKLSDETLPKLRKIFAAMNRDKAAKGVMIQNEQGAWTKKGEAGGHL